MSDPTLRAKLDKGEFILADKSNHASLVEGCRLALGPVIKSDRDQVRPVDHVIVRHDMTLTVVDPA